MNPPEPLDSTLHAIWQEVADDLKDKTPAAIVESICTQIKAMRDIRALIDTDGVMVRDGKNNPVPHPGLQMERDAQKHLAAMMNMWIKR